MARCLPNNALAAVARRLDARLPERIPRKARRLQLGLLEKFFPAESDVPFLSNVVDDACEKRIATVSILVGRARLPGRIVPQVAFDGCK